MTTHLNLFVVGAPVGRTQPVEVEKIEPGIYKILYSPGLVEGIAAGDVIRLTDVSLGLFEIVNRGGNISVKWMASSPISEFLNQADQILKPLGSRRDGDIAKAAVWTIPISATFVAIEEAMEKVIELVPDSGWWYGNVYDENDNPLNWW
ncbi:DUF4265 domain-containing protein [Phycisphaeraceae bacterium D3-23]